MPLLDTRTRYTLKGGQRASTMLQSFCETISHIADARARRTESQDQPDSVPWLRPNLPGQKLFRTQIFASTVRRDRASAQIFSIRLPPGGETVTQTDPRCGRERGALQAIGDSREPLRRDREPKRARLRGRGLNHRAARSRGNDTHELEPAASFQVGRGDVKLSGDDR